MRKNILLFSLICLTIYLHGCSNANSFLGQKANPYFYNVDYIVLEATAEYYEVETRVEKVIAVEVSLVKSYEQGGLYKFAIEPVGYLDDARTTIYFYVTDQKIYRLWAYAYQEGEMIEFYNNDELIIKYFDTDQKLVENGEIVCQLEKISSERDDGTISSISQSEDKVIYSRCDRHQNGEIGFYEWFVWETSKGLVNYGSGFGNEGDILYLKQIEEVHN